MKPLSTLREPSCPEGYVIRPLSEQVFERLTQGPLRSLFFDASPVFRPSDVLNAAELEKLEALRFRLEDRYCLFLGIFHSEKLVGWSWGYQESADTFYMTNSAVLAEHRRKGLYTALILNVLDRVTAQGFTKVYSRHVATNNAVIISKLKAGFVITALEISDAWGILVQLAFYAHPTRRKMMDFRTGRIRPDEEIKRLLRL